MGGGGGSGPGFLGVPGSGGGGKCPRPITPYIHGIKMKFGRVVEKLNLLIFV